MIKCFFATTLFLVGVDLAMAEPVRTPVTPQEAHQWLLHVIPLPKQATIDARTIVPASRVRVTVQEQGALPHVLEAESLARDLQQRGVGEGRPDPDDADFTIKVGILDAQGRMDGDAVPGADQLRQVKNADQAYVICPLGERTLLVTGTHSNGVFYGVKTLRQLMVLSVKGEGAQTMARVPLAQILDWPIWPSVANGVEASTGTSSGLPIGR